VALALNVTAIGATAPTFLTVWPGGTRPTASSLNPVPGQPPTPNGVIAQWVPFHILSVHDAVAIATTFQDVFTDALLWLDPKSRTGILVGRRGPPSADFATQWPGFDRTPIERGLSAAEVRTWVALDPFALREYAKMGVVITDDNQLLAYGPHRNRDYAVARDLEGDNLALVKRVAASYIKPTR